MLQLILAILALIPLESDVGHPVILRLSQTKSHTLVWLQRATSNSRAQKGKSLREIFVEGFGCEIAILVPPLSGPINLGLCALRGADVHGLSSRDDGRASQAPLQQIALPRDQLRQWKGATLPLARA